MKVKIKKGKDKKEFNLINDWSDVTLEKWAILIDSENGSQSDKALETIAALSDIPKKLIKELGIEDVSKIMQKISDIQGNENNSLKRIIEVEGNEYGFHPNLSDITLGEYADIETFIKNGLENHLAELMAVLYRPITEKGENDVYTIEAYDGNIAIRTEQMKKMSAEQVQGALVFFWSFVKKLLMTLPSFLMDQIQATLKASQMEISQKSGVGLA